GPGFVFVNRLAASCASTYVTSAFVADRDASAALVDEPSRRISATPVAEMASLPSAFGTTTPSESVSAIGGSSLIVQGVRAPFLPRTALRGGPRRPLLSCHGRPFLPRHTVAGHGDRSDSDGMRDAHVRVDRSGVLDHDPPHGQASNVVVAHLDHIA